MRETVTWTTTHGGRRKKWSDSRYILKTGGKHLLTVWIWATQFFKNEVLCTNLISSVTVNHLEEWHRVGWLLTSTDILATPYKHRKLHPYKPPLPKHQWIPNPPTRQAGSCGDWKNFFTLSLSWHILLTFKNWAINLRGYKVSF